MKQISTILLTSILLMQTSIAFATDISPIDIINKVTQNKNQSFSGTRLQKVVRGNLSLESNANVDYVDANNFNITIKSPNAISGLKYATNSGKSIIYFPYEKLSFTDAIPSSGDMITDTIMGKITSDSNLLQKNYIISLKKDDEIVSNSTYVIDIKPRTDTYSAQDNKVWHTPRRTFWVNKSNFQILREDRSWSEDNQAFFSSQYTTYKPLSYSNSPNVRVKLPYNVKKVPLGKKNSEIETYFESYSNILDFEKGDKEKIISPKYLPVGFKLKEIQVLNFYDTKIILQKYNDGLNSMFVTYRSRPNFFLTLLAGNFSLDLLHKMSELSLNAPYNYITRETKGNLVISFGDILPDELQKVNNSVTVS